MRNDNINQSEQIDYCSCQDSNGGITGTKNVMDVLMGLQLEVEIFRIVLLKFLKIQDVKAFERFLKFLTFEVFYFFLKFLYKDDKQLFNYWAISAENSSQTLFIPKVKVKQE